MHRYVGIFAAICAIIGFISTALMLHGTVNSAGMAVLLFHIWGIAASLVAVIMGFAGRWMAGRVPTTISRASDFGLGLGLGTLLAQAIAFMILG